MKTFFKIILFGALSFYFASCEEEDDSASQPQISAPTQTYDNYSQLKVGNYWIYERFELQPNGTETSLNQLDSSYVEKDTLINNKKYYKLHRPSLMARGIPQNLYLRDSLHYLIDAAGEVQFSSRLFQQFLNPVYISPDSLYSRSRIMNYKDSSVTVPAGNFTVLGSTEIFEHMGILAMRGKRYRKTLYAKDIGVVYETLPFYSAQPNYTIQKLVRYKLN